jgi:NAD(P)H-hydrate repair Nnr-like enzyme with NAD(P)H-hydrate dehydratase domain
VLKGAYTTISDGEFYYINPVANPALATAGSGDVLTGIITGLLAQKYEPMAAALLGVYLHSQTAENYVKKYNNYSMIASDIIEGLKEV